MRKFTAFTENLLAALTNYPRVERNGVMLVVIVVGVLLGWIAFRPSRPLDEAYFAEADRLNDSLRADYYRGLSALRASRTDSIAAATAGQFRSGSGGKPTVYIELNAADSAKLCTVRGIGPVISKNIVQYRNRLGGFVRKSQLKEVWGITDENFDAISAQFFIDTAAVQKINLNFVPAKSLRAHPYFSRSMEERILEARKLKGGWNQLRELVDNDILLPDEAEKVAAYVVFTAH